MWTEARLVPAGVPTPAGDSVKGMAFSPAVHRLIRVMPQRAGGFFHLHLVSDATGETLITVARAAAAQYASVAPIEHIYPLVRTEKQLERVISEIEGAPCTGACTQRDAGLAGPVQT